MIVDLHVHSKHARGTSSSMDINNLEKYGRIKGVELLGTGDFTHPVWIKELKEKLKDDGTGIFRTKTGFPFILQTEISLIYSAEGKGRRVHVVVLAPSFEAVDKITAYLLSKGRIDYDGRPIFGISARDFASEMEKIDKNIEVIPAHIWTPWFGLLGSKGGFDSVKEAFGDKEHLIHAIETGLSSDPPMNWRLSSLDKYQIVSFSDLHSYWPWRMAREATIFDCEMKYQNILNAIRTGKGLFGTIEVDPGYGKYHYDGHRNCNVRLSPKETKKVNGICPVCGKPLVIGVEYRVEELADRAEGFIRSDKKKFYKLLPLSDILSAFVGAGVATQKVWKKYYEIVKDTNEYNFLLNMDEKELISRCGSELATVLIRNRRGEIEVDPGYDGVYGVAKIFENKEKPISLKTVKEIKKSPQKTLGEY